MKTQGLNLHTKEGMISLYREFSEVIAHLDKILYSFSGMSELSSAGIGSSKDFAFSHIPELYRIKEDMILKIGKAVVNESGGLL